ncbi:uncharacterized protein [Ptychodera flava]|uniref:uncharacterized protein n=1 Tax=Ptychodera flava TaxID=63121 RepID=UPI003969DFB1
MSSIPVPSSLEPVQTPTMATTLSPIVSGFSTSPGFTGSIFTPPSRTLSLPTVIKASSTFHVTLPVTRRQSEFSTSPIAGAPPTVSPTLSVIPSPLLISTEPRTVTSSVASQGSQIASTTATESLSISQSESLFSSATILKPIRSIETTTAGSATASTQTRPIIISSVSPIQTVGSSAASETTRLPMLSSQSISLVDVTKAITTEFPSIQPSLPVTRSVVTSLSNTPEYSRSKTVSSSVRVGTTLPSQSLSIGSIESTISQTISPISEVLTASPSKMSSITRSSIQTHISTVGHPVTSLYTPPRSQTTVPMTDTITASTQTLPSMQALSSFAPTESSFIHTPSSSLLTFSATKTPGISIKPSEGVETSIQPGTTSSQGPDTRSTHSVLPIISSSQDFHRSSSRFEFLTPQLSATITSPVPAISKTLKPFTSERTPVSVSTVYFQTPIASSSPITTILPSPETSEMLKQSTDAVISPASSSETAFPTYSLLRPSSVLSQTIRSVSVSHMSSSLLFTTSKIQTSRIGESSKNYLKALLLQHQSL